MNLRSRASAIVAALLLSATARAGVIEYDVINVTGSTWQYTYNVTNDELNGGLFEFTIWFAAELYESLAVAASPAGWDSIVLQPDLALPHDGFFDSLSLGAAIPIGSALGGFSVTFDWLGTGTPGSQAFDFVDPDTFEVLDSGFTRRPGSPTPVPEPAIALLLAAGIAAVTFAARRRRVR